MSRKKKNRNHVTDPNKVIILVTVILQLISTIISMIEKLIE